MVTTLRLWALNHDHPQAGHPDWQEGLAAAGLDVAAHSAFGGLMGTIAAAPRRKLDIRCLDCHTLGHDEALFLQAMALLQIHHLQSAAAILGDWTPFAGVRLAMPAAHGLAMALAQAGLILPFRCLTAARLQALSPVYANPGLARVQ